MGSTKFVVSVNPRFQKTLFFLVGSSFHLGKYNRFRDERIIAYLLGARINIDYFRGIIAVVHLKVALRFFWKRVLERLLPKVLFFSQHFIVSKFISRVIGISSAFLVNRWPAGIIGNWHTKVSIPFINYQSTVFYKLTKSEHNRYFKLFSGFTCLLGKPDLVIFLEYPGSMALKDCWLNGVPTVSVADSNSNVLHATYVIPGNPNGTVQCIILSIFLELLFWFIFLFMVREASLGFKTNFYLVVLVRFQSYFYFLLYLLYFIRFNMATRLLQRREHRKLNNVRSVIWKAFLKKQVNGQFKPVFGLTHHSRLLKQQKSSWFCAKWVSLVFAQFAVLPNCTYVLRSRQISTGIKTYFIKHRRVQELKAFYGSILRKVFSSFVAGCGIFYRKQVFFKPYNLLNRLKKALSLRSSLVSILESRLVSVLWRSFFCASVIGAHKLVVFGSVKVIGSFVTKASFLLKPGNSVVVVNLSWFVAEFIQRSVAWRKLAFRVPLPHLEVSFALHSVIFLYKPFDLELSFPFAPKTLFVRSFYFQ